MKKITMIVFSVLLLMGCSQSNASRHTELEEALHSVVEDETISEINVNVLTNFDWDKGFLFTPYTPEQNIEAQLGVHFKDRSHIAMRDDIYLLVFVNDNQVAHYAELNRLQTDYSIGEREYLTPSNTAINIKRH